MAIIYNFKSGTRRSNKRFLPTAFNTTGKKKDRIRYRLFKGVPAVCDVSLCNAPINCIYGDSRCVFEVGCSEIS